MKSLYDVNLSSNEKKKTTLQCYNKFLEINAH